MAIWFTEVEKKLLRSKAKGMTDGEAGAEGGYTLRGVEDLLARLRRRAQVRKTWQLVAVFEAQERAARRDPRMPGERESGRGGERESGRAGERESGRT